MAAGKRYVEVIVPLKLKGTLTYSVPDESVNPQVGAWVVITLRGHDTLGVVSAVNDSAPIGVGLTSILAVKEFLDRPGVSSGELQFWQNVADYYMCSIGEVLKAACNVALQKYIVSPPRRSVRKKSSPEKCKPQNVLSQVQSGAYAQIVKGFEEGRPVLLHGVTGSGKTEIYLQLAAERLAQGRDVLMLVPEIAMSRQLEQRLESVLGDSLLVFHSGQTAAAKRRVIDALRSERKEARIVLGTRSAVFLPFRNLSLVIIDEEHDHSYKQEDPAPRYNGRDCALMLASLARADVLLGSATPSYESLFNVSVGKFVQVDLLEKYHSSQGPDIEIVDTVKEYRLHNMQGSFSRKVLKQMESVLESGQQIMVFRSRRAYAPVMQCKECGDSAKCPHCNVSLSYHKFNNTLSCHYCGYSVPFTTRCKSCGAPGLVEHGAGTEKIEEELQEYFPDRKIVRFDADTASDAKHQKQLIKDFSEGAIDIVVGTQMITKGFDFGNLAMIVAVSADSLFAVQDFRGDEKALQLLTQLMGRAGRRGQKCRFVIQTSQPQHPVINRLVSGAIDESTLDERRMFAYPPYVRLICITVRDDYEGRLWNVCRLVKAAAEQSGVKDIAGPTVPAVDFVGDRFIAQIWIKLPREKTSISIKKALSERIGLIEKDFKGKTSISVDVDPL